LQQTLELVTENFHSLITHDFNVDGISEIMATRLVKNGTDINIIHPKQLANQYVRINDYVNTLCITQTSMDRGFELVTGDRKGVIRINSRDGKPFFGKDIKDGIRLQTGILSSAPGDLNGNKLSEVVVGCQNGEVVMVERIPGKKYKWDKIRGFSLGQVFQIEVTQMLTGDFNGNGQVGFIAGGKDGIFKEIEFRPQLQKFDLISEMKVETEPSFCFSGDFDRDGISEVMIGEYSGRLSIFKRSRLMSTHNFDGIITCGTVGDIDNDRQLEVIVGTSNGSFHILRSNTIETHEGYGNIADLKVGDLTGNRLNDLVFSIDKRRIIAFNLTRDLKNEKPNVDLLPYGPKGATIRKQIDSETQPDTTEIYCPNCESEVKFIEQYRRWYCYSCRQYVAPISKQEQKSKSKPLIEPQSQGSPYEPYATSSVGYQAYKPEPSTPYPAKQTIEKVKTKVEGSLAGVGDVKELQWQENKIAITADEKETEYFLPLDLETDVNQGAAFFNDILKIKHVILIHSSSGVPLFSQGFGKDIDVSLTSGFLSAVGTFTEEMAGETEKRVGVFSEIGREGFWIIIYEGYQSKTALLVSEKISQFLKQRITVFMKEFEQKYSGDLDNFSGFVSVFSGTTDLLEKHLRIEYLYPLKIDIKRIRLTAITQNEKKVAKTLTDFLKDTNEEVFYVAELLEVLFKQEQMIISKEEALKVLIKYLENGMLAPLPPPPEQPM